MHFGPFRSLSQQCQELAPLTTRSTTDLAPRAPESPTPDSNFSNQWTRHPPCKGFAESHLVTQPCQPSTSSLHTREILARNWAWGQPRLPDCSQVLACQKRKTYAVHIGASSERRVQVTRRETRKIFPTKDHFPKVWQQN